MLNGSLTISSICRKRQQSAEHTATSCMQLQALDLTLIPHFVNSCLSRCQPEPNWSQSFLAPRLVQIAPPPRAPARGAKGAFWPRVLSYHPHPPLRPPLCCAGTRLCSHARSQMVGLIRLENCLSVSRRRVISQPERRRSRGRGLCRCARGRAHPHPSETGASGQQTWRAGLRLQLRLLQITSCITLQQREVSPKKICLCELQPKDWTLQNERFPRSKALFKITAPVLAGEERKT